MNRPYRGPAAMRGWLLVLAATVSSPAMAHPVRPAPNTEPPGTVVTGTTGQETAKQEALARIKTLHERLRLSPRDSYLNYAIATLARRARIDLSKEEIVFPLVPVVTDDPARRTDLFALAAGVTALHESLQLTEMLGPVRSGSGRHVPIERLAPPALPALDYPHLEAVRREAGGAAWEGDEGFLEDARMVPAEWIFARFASGTELLAVLREIEAWMRHLELSYGMGRGRTDFLWRFFDDLGLPDPRRVPGFYEVMRGPLAITMSDPFVREGTDVTVILPEGTPVSLTDLMAPREGTDPKRYWARIRGRVLFSSSPAAIERLRALDPADSLAECADLHHAAARLPPRDDQAAVVFLSERFLEHLSGPHVRLLESRRVRCASHLRTIVNALLLQREEKCRDGEPSTGAPLATREELVREGYLSEAMLRCPQGGVYRLEGDPPATTKGEAALVPTCSIHGRPGHLEPLIGMELPEVSEEESAAYQRFARSYARFWQRAFDPALITADREGDSWCVNALVMPFAENSFYRNLSRLCGGAPLDEAALVTLPRTIFSTTMLAEEDLLEGLVDLLERQGLLDPASRAAARAGLPDSRLVALREGFTREVTLGLLDAPLLFDFDLPMFLAEALRWNIRQDIAMAPLLAGASLPAYLVCPVRDSTAARRFLDALHDGAVRRGGTPRSSRFALHYQGYDLGTGESAPPIRALTLEIFAFELRLFYALHDDRLYVAARPDVLQQVLSLGHTEPVAEPFNLHIALHPMHWEAIRPSLELDYEESARRRCLADLIALEPFDKLGLDSWPEALHLVAPCPDGGTRATDAGTPLRCSVHGRPEAPRQPPRPRPENAVSMLLEHLRRLTFSLRFIPDGLHATVRIER